MEDDYMRKSNETYDEQEVEQEVSGNTIQKPPSRIQACGWALTIWNSDVKILDFIKDILLNNTNNPLKTFTNKIRYIISGIELCPTTNNTHYQTYILFHKKIDLNVLKHYFPTSHIEVAKGNPFQNKKYCEKDNNLFIEWGNPPNPGKKKYTADEIKNMTTTDIIENIPIMQQRAYFSARDILSNDIDINNIFKKVKVYFISGDSSIGKSTKITPQIVNEHKDEYGTIVNHVKCINGFWTGIGTSKIAIYDDWRDSDMTPREFINFIDYQSHIMNIKGGCHRNKYELIIINSIQQLGDIYKNSKEPRRQWERRITNYINYWPEDIVEELDRILALESHDS